MAERAAQREASSAVWHAQDTIHEACGGAAVSVRHEHISSKQQLVKMPSSQLAPTTESWVGLKVHERLLWCAHTPSSTVPAVRQLLNCHGQ